MSLQKIFIITGLVIIIAVSAIMLYLSSQKKETVSQEPTQNGESAVPASLPSKGESSGSQGNVEKARKIFENTTLETISEKTKIDGSKEVDFKDQKGNPIPLSDFEDALGVEIYPKLQEYLNNGYQVFYCPGADGKKEFGVYLEYNQEKVYNGFTSDVLNMMQGWENAIFPNLHAVLFPGIDFREDSLNQKIEFRGGKYRYADVNLPGGRKSSVQYDAVESGIIIAASPACLDNVHQYYEPAMPSQP
ncbi:MAG: hypothetical protein PHP25_03740 [Candidatus Moranbacteria bacterium]|nr:hypothetical protein [Candidatus Moranbacteria bacterium]